MRRRREVQPRQAGTIDWTGPRGNSSRVNVPECRDGAGLILTAGDDIGKINATMNFKGSFIELYGTRHLNGAPGIIVVDGDYNGLQHVDQSLAAAESTDTACIKIAGFYDLQPTDHILEITLGSAAVQGMTFIVANVTTEISSSNPSGQQGPPVSDKAPRPEHEAGPNIAAIIGPIVAIILLIAGGVFLWLLRRRRIRNAKKAPSNAFRAAHPELPMRNLQSDGQSEAGTGIHTPAHSAAMSPHPSMQYQHHANASSSSGGTLVESYAYAKSHKSYDKESSMVGEYADEKKRLQEILAVRDEQELAARERERWDGERGQPMAVWDAYDGRPAAVWDAYDDHQQHQRPGHGAGAGGSGRTGWNESRR